MFLEAEMMPTVEGFGPPEPFEHPEDARELVDKVLAAFHLAYSVGRRDVAQSLMDALDRCLVGEAEEGSATALTKARHWMRFVHTRDAYNAIREKRGDAAIETIAASRAMREAYIRWSRA